VRIFASEGGLTDIEYARVMQAEAGSFGVSRLAAYEQYYRPVSFQVLSKSMSIR
jgi:hypothetical protein